MTKITLFDRSEEIYNLLPEKYAEIIINSIIARSLKNGILLNEASVFMSKDALEKLSEEIDYKPKPIQNKATPLPKRVQDKKEKKKQEDEEGFDAFENFE